MENTQGNKMITQEQKLFNAKDIARVVICSFSKKEKVDKWLETYKGVELNEHDELDLIAIHIKKQLLNPNFDLEDYKKVHKPKKEKVRKRKKL